MRSAGAGLGARARDRLGRYVEPGSTEAVSSVGDEPLPPQQALSLARRLLADGRAFSAHEVLEASWKAAPPAERELWRGLAQVCVGLTHLQRGNPTGAAALLRRGAGLLVAAAPIHGLQPRRIAADAEQLAKRVDAGATEGQLRL